MGLLLTYFDYIDHVIDLGFLKQLAVYIVPGFNFKFNSFEKIPNNVMMQKWLTNILRFGNKGLCSTLQRLLWVGLLIEYWFWKTSMVLLRYTSTENYIIFMRNELLSRYCKNYNIGQI